MSWMYRRCIFLSEITNLILLLKHFSATVMNEIQCLMLTMRAVEGKRMRLGNKWPIYCILEQKTNKLSIYDLLHCCVENNCVCIFLGLSVCICSSDVDSVAKKERERICMTVKAALHKRWSNGIAHVLVNDNRNWHRLAANT